MSGNESVRTPAIMHWYWIVVALVVIALGPLIVWILRPEGIALWWGDDLEPRLRPLYYLVSSAAVIGGVLWAERLLDWWGRIGLSHKLKIVGPLVAVCFGFFVGATGTYAPPFLSVHSVLADENTLIALSEDRQRVWIRDLPSVITHLLQPEDLDNDGVREIVVATAPSGTKSSRLLILDEDGRIIFDSDYVVHVWEDFVRRVRIPYEDIVLDRLGKVVAVYRANGELAEQYTWKDAWESIRPDRYGLPGGKYEVRALLTGNVDDSLEKEIIVVAGEPYERGLSFVAKLAPNGELLGSYWHPGPIYQVVILENVDNDAANIIGVGENSFLYSGQIFDYVFGLSGHLLTELSGWNLMKPEDLSMPKNELWQKVPGTTLWDRYEEVLRWYRWISPPKRMIMEVDVSYRPTWMGKQGLGPRQAMIDIKLKDGSYFSLNAKGDIVAQWVPAGSSTRLNERQQVYSAHMHCSSLRNLDLRR